MLPLNESGISRIFILDYFDILGDITFLY
jgi:hypothetical protein